MLKGKLNIIQKRQSMLGHPKYRHKEEKKKMLKMSHKKLLNIDDPESLLCKAVLINNTLKNLQNSSITVTYNSENEEASEEETENKVELDAQSKSSSPSNYRIEDILSEIVFPPPLAPQMEEFTNYKIVDKSNELNSEDFINVCDDAQTQVTHESFYEEKGSSGTIKVQ